MTTASDGDGNSRAQDVHRRADTAHARTEAARARTLRAEELALDTHRRAVDLHRIAAESQAEHAAHARSLGLDETAAAMDARADRDREFERRARERLEKARRELELKGHRHDGVREDSRS
jgi:hypothetical protein